jgi:hypothetical protein
LRIDYFPHNVGRGDFRHSRISRKNTETVRFGHSMNATILLIVIPANAGIQRLRRG